MTDEKLGRKFDAGKLRFSLLPLRPLRKVLEVLEYGAKKYAPNNWKHVEGAHDRYYDAAMRHLTDWREAHEEGASVADAETGVSHLAHAICCLLFLMWFEDEKPEKPEPASTQKFVLFSWGEMVDASAIVSLDRSTILEYQVIPGLKHTPALEAIVAASQDFSLSDAVHRHPELAGTYTHTRHTLFLSDMTAEALEEFYEVLQQGGRDTEAGILRAHYAQKGTDKYIELFIDRDGRLDHRERENV